MRLFWRRSHQKAKYQWFQLLTATLITMGSCNNAPVLFAQTSNQSLDSVQINNQVNYTYKTNINNEIVIGESPKITVDILRLRDPFGRITGCAGEILPDYSGFTVGVYETAANGIDIRNPLALTATEVPNNPNNNIPRGLAPNKQNSNPFFLTNSDGGTYNFLFDEKRGQLDAGKTYILLVNPAPGSIYDQRRIRLVIGVRNGDSVPYTATALDGKPIGATDNRTSVEGVINIQDVERVGLSLAVLRLNASICQAQEIQITKTGDRAAAEPGDAVIYRLAVKNLASAALNNLVIADTLPLGFNFLPKSVRAEFNGTPVPITATHNGRAIVLKAEGFTLPSTSGGQGTTLSIAYAAVLTPDSLRGTGENSALVNAQRIDNRREVKDGPAIYRLRVKSGILSDCGTLIGRVFIDKNFDGEQQANEPGIPNAVIYMDDGNRIISDPNGLFSVANVIAGYRTAVLDLSSLPGYALAPNSRFKERNSQSRLVHLEPGGLGRINFAVTPAFQEGRQR